MLVERTLHPDFLANTYLVGDGQGGGFLVDAGGPVGPLLDAAEREGITPSHVLLTHHHWDHIAELPQLLERWPRLAVLSHPQETELARAATPELADLITGELVPDEPVRAGVLEVTPLHTPGHTTGMVALLVDGHVFTGDTLFKNSVGGVRAPGHATYADLKHSIMDVLLTLPPETVILPGHTDATTVAEELESNAFVRVWRGLDAEGDEPCTALGEPARLVLLGDDYDGGHKAWIRWPDGSDDIVPGSKIERV